MEVSEIHLYRGNELSARIEGRPGEKLSRAIWLSGQVAPAPLCNGLGLCGLCKLRFRRDAPAPEERDIRYFRPEELASGWRLACSHKVPDHELELELPRADFEKRGFSFTPLACRKPAWLGIDLGTTSLQWRAVNEAGETLLEGGLLNPQAGAGADIVARIAYARTPEGRGLLAKLAWDAIDQIRDELGQAGFDIQRICIAANSALTEILFEKDLSGLAHAPYKLSWQAGQVLPGCGLELVIPPLVAPFIGGDVSAGLLALAKCDRPFILADLGTNAELALMAAGAYFASAPLGPALEGIGPRCGRMVAADIASAFRISAGGIEARTFVNDTYHSLEDLKGISGTGYISLIALLLRLGVIDDEGHFVPPEKIAMPVAKKIAARQRLLNGEPALFLADRLYLAASDLELLLKVKAAFQVALSSLLQSAKLRGGQLQALYLAGALGQYSESEDLALLGFIPRSLQAKSRRAGNTALAGACLLALKPDLLAELKAMLSGCQVIDLLNEPEFFSDYMQAMRWGSN